MSLQNVVHTKNYEIASSTAPKITALYLRLSSDDGNLGDSDSIVNQRAIVTKYAQDNGFTNLMEFVDDGWSGVDFDNRPGFQQMLALVESGQVGAVIVKDLSRLGREYIHMGLYTEIIFPRFCVRFIAINDSVDSNKGADDFTALRNLFNEWFIRDTSRKIRAVTDMKAKQGRRTNGSAPYGYIFDKELDKLVIDEVTAPTIRRIFDLYLSGLGFIKIAKILTADSVPTPTVYRNYNTKNPNATPDKWSHSSVSEIVNAQVYLGHTVSKQTYSISYKHKGRIDNKEEDMIIVRDTHEPIIDEETFAIAKNLRIGKRRATKNGELVIFSGLLTCSTCGKKHHLMKGGKDNRHKWLYICGSYGKRGRDYCTAHGIMLGALEKIVTEHIRLVISCVKEDETAFAEKLMENGAIAQKAGIARHKRELDKVRRRVNELDTLFNKIYEDRTLGNLSEERYQRMSANYEQEHQVLSDKIQTLETEIAKSADTIAGIDKFIKIAKKHLGLQELNAVILRELIEKIVIHEKVKVNEVDSSGEVRRSVRQQVDIYYNFVGVIG